jgi:hypothetical protein
MHAALVPDSSVTLIVSILKRSRQTQRPQPAEASLAQELDSLEMPDRLLDIPMIRAQPLQQHGG